MLSIYVIGCGGIGGFVCDNLLMQLSSISLDAIEQSGTSIKPWLEGAGNKALPRVGVAASCLLYLLFPLLKKGLLLFLGGSGRFSARFGSSGRLQA